MIATIIAVIIIIIAFVTVFSVQNAAPVVLSFLFWKFQASLAIVIFLSLLSGAIIGAIIASLIRWKTNKKSAAAVTGQPK
jgi:uncharacterized integral membrane protein